jgi:hypothetical protein
VGFVMLWIAETLSGTGVSAIFDSKVDLWLGLRTLTWQQNKIRKKERRKGGESTRKEDCY